MAQALSRGLEVSLREVQLCDMLHYITIHCGKSLKIHLIFQETNYDLTNIMFSTFDTVQFLGSLLFHFLSPNW